MKALFSSVTTRPSAMRLLKRQGRKLLNSMLRPIGYVPISHVSPIGTMANKERFLDNPYVKVSFGQQGEDIIIDRIFRVMLNTDPDTFKGLYVDVGAYHPQSHSTTYLLYERGWRGICVDMSAETCALFQMMRPGDSVWNVAISDQNGEITGYFPNEISLRSTISAEERNPAVTYQERTVPTTTLNAILSKEGVDRRIDYLNLDIEGAEIAALTGLNFERYRPRLISVEIHSASAADALQSNVATLLHNRGYACVGVAVITYFFVDTTDPDLTIKTSLAAIKGPAMRTGGGASAQTGN